MTNEQKAKAYDEALERAKELLDSPRTCFDIVQLKDIFPQLAESEDERIREELLFHIQSEIDTYDNMISGDYDSRDKEDKKVHSMLKRAKAYLENQKESGIKWLKSDNVKNPDKPYIDKAGMFYTTDGRMCYASEIEKQKDLDKMIVVSPGVWDKAISDAFENGKKEGEKQKENTWSEEDDAKVKTMCKEGDLKPSERAWLMDLKNRVWKEQKPVEWSEEDEDNLRRVTRIIEDNDSDWKELTDWLKSLRPQYHGDVTMTEAYKMGKEAGEASHWKPSEEQMYSLGTVVKGYDECTVGSVGYNLKELYEQLKKL